MRSFTKLALTAALAVFSAGGAIAATTLNVFMHDERGEGYPVSAVTIVAVNWGMNGPSTSTVMGVTGPDGKAQLALADNLGYSVYFSSHGYSPSIADQFNNPDFDNSNSRWLWTNGVPLSSTFTLTSGLADVGTLKQEFTGASTGTVLFGGVWNMKSQLQGGQGIVVTSIVDGSGTLVVDNVPFADPNTYNIGLYDPRKNSGIGRNVMSSLSAGTPVVEYIGAAKLDFNKAIPPARVEDTNTSGGAASGASVEGLMVSTTGRPIPWMGIEVKACDGFEWRNWAHVGEDGRFKLYGLRAGTTYYVSAHGGCTWEKDSPEGKCYEPFASANFNAPDICQADHSLVASNDIVYLSSADVMYHKVTLQEMPKSIGKISVYVKSDNGFIIPNANVNVNPDGSPWPLFPHSCAAVDAFNNIISSNFANMPGFSNLNVNAATGYALLDGLPSGNYMINVWTPFSKGGDNGPMPWNGNLASGGENAKFGGWNNNCQNQNCWLQAHCNGVGANDYRITIATGAAEADRFAVYDSSGARVALSSITYTVAAGGLNMAGELKGTVKFPGVVDLTNNPILLTLYPNCDKGGCDGASGNFTALMGSGSDRYNYSIRVSTGYSYHLNVRAVGWGRVQRGGGDNTVSLKSTGTVVVDLEFAPAGGIKGTLFKPDGSVFTPANNQWIWVDAGNNTGWTGAQLQKDGSFEMTDVLPGVNRISVNASGDGASFDYALPSPTPMVTVVAGSTSTLNLNLVDAKYVGIAFSTAAVPDPTIIMDRYDAVLGFKVVPLPSGTVFKSETVIKMLTGGDGENERKFRFSAPTGMDEEGPCGKGWRGGFCAAPMASPSLYDFYLMRSGDFSKSTDAVTGVYPHFTMLTSSKNVIIDSAHAVKPVWKSWSMTPSTGVLVNLTPVPSMAGRGNATLKGSISANNFFRRVDYEACGGDFDKFVQYLPVMALYDSEGAFKAAGIVVPPPAFIAQSGDAFDLAFMQGYESFSALLNHPSAKPFGYEIRGLDPRSGYNCYTAVLTTPNYPPYQKRVCVGANGTTTTLDVDLDAAVGAGATVQGVVTSTNTSVKLANVSVEISGDGLITKTAVTDSSGVYKFEGLPEGTVRLKVTADGYSLADAEKDLVGSNSYTQDFSLTAAGGSITGTVYSQKLPFSKVQPGAQIVAYNDTYNGTTTGATPLLKTRTGSDGTYKLTGLVPGDVYKVFLKVPGKYTLSLTTEAINGNIPDMDFTMKPKPMDIEMFARRNDEAGVYEFTVLNPQDFKTGEARWKAAPYSAAGSTALELEKMSNGELRGTIPLDSLTDGIIYVLHGSATSYSNKNVEKEILFGKGLKGNAAQSIDDAILGDDSEDEKGRRNNEAAMDQSGGDPTAVTFPPGAVQATAGVPTCSLKGEEKTDPAVAAKVAGLGADAFAGDLYTIALSSVSVNDGKSIEITLAYDKSTADLDDLSVARYNDGSGKWEQLSGVATVNPMKGTVKVKLRSLASVLAVKPGEARFKVNSFDGKQYRVSAAGASSTSGTFAVVRPSIAGNAYAGTKLKVFNYPNPFNLKTRTVNNSQGAALSGNTEGTVIHVEVPAGNGGDGHVRIYTLAGELVNDLRTNFTAGAHNYVLWNGRNKAGQPVANGVYYGVVELAGKAPDREDATFKMVVVK